MVGSAAITCSASSASRSRQGAATASAICALGQAAHLGDLAGELLQLAVEGLDGVFGHHGRVIGLRRQPKRPVM